MSKFEIGQKVRIVNKPFMLYSDGGKDYKKNWKIGDEFIIKRINRNGDLESEEIRNGEYYINQSCVELVEEPHYKKYIGKKYAVHCKTQEEWDKVCKFLDSVGERLGYTGRKFSEWGVYPASKGETCMSLDNGYGYCHKGWYEKEGYTILSFKEFMGEEEDKLLFTTPPDAKQNNLIGEEIGFDHINAIPAFSMRPESMSLIEELRQYNYKPNIIKTTMENVIKTLREIPKTLAKVIPGGMKDQYKLGWRNGNLELTEEGKNELMEMLAEKFEKEFSELASNEVKEIEKKK